MDVYTLCAQIYYEEIMAKPVKQTTINIRVDAKTKKQAEKIFARCGYTTSSAVRLFLLRAIKENDWPFDIHIPNAETIAAMQEDLSDAKSYDNVQEMLDEIYVEMLEEDKAEKQKVSSKSKRSAKR